MAKLLGNAIIEGKIRTLTGIHIGGSTESLQIGGIDSPVLRDPNTKFPYIPGSSLKGKLRMLTEFAEGLITDGGPVKNPEHKPAQIFGTSADEAKLGPTRLTVRDSYPDNETIEMWKNLDSDLLFTEYKGENNIDRITSKATPRFFERVVRDSKFDLEIVYSFYDISDIDGAPKVDDFENFKTVFQSLMLLEQSSLGGHGSRGYGRVEFLIKRISFFSVDDYKMGKAVLTESDKELKKLTEISIDEQIELIKSKLS